MTAPGKWLRQGRAAGCGLGRCLCLLLAQGWEMDDILHQYPALTRADVQACLHYASDTLKSERVYPLAADPEA